MAAKRSLVPRTFLKAAGARNFGGAYIIYGYDEFIKAETVRLAVEAHVPEATRSFGVTHLLGSHTDATEILNAAQVIPMLGSRTAVVVHDGHKLASAHKSRLPGLLASVSHPSLVVFVGAERLDLRTRFYKWFTDSGRAVLCEPLTEKQAEVFAQRRFKDAGKNADRETLGALLARTGPDAGAIAREAEKLALYVGEQDTVKRGDVETVTGHSAGCTPEDLMDALVAGRSPRALHVARTLIAAGMDAVGLIGRLTLHYFDLQRATAAGVAHPWKLAGILKLPAVRAEQLCRWQKQADPRKTAAALEWIADAEALARSGRAEPELLLDALVLSLAHGNRAATAPFNR
jgi:DNA polymerase-3 subunit delta